MTARVLIVDDDGNNRLLLETLLKSRGFEVLSAVNGEEGLARARSHHPDLIVSDILMPVMDGYTFCRQLKSDDALKRIPFVFFTASYNTPKDEEFAMSLGAERFVFKPQEPEELIAILEEVLKESRLTPRRAKKPLGEEMEFFRQHNEVLFNQLEKKLLDLEQANERLRMMEEQYRLSFENITDMVLVFDGNLTITSVSPSAERILGYRPEEFVGRPIDDLKTILTPESFQMAVQNIGQILQGEIITSAVYDVIARDGTRKYLDITRSPLVRDGKIDGLVCDARDVTERVLAESARRESEELFGQFMRYFPGSAYIKDSDRRIIYLTGNTEEYFGVKPQEWLGKRSEDIWPEEIALLSRKDDEAVLRGEVVQSISQRPQKDGAHTWITHRFPIHRHNKPPLIGCISLDITGQKQAEENLRESEKRYRELYDFLPIPVYEMDFQSTIPSVTHAIYETFGGTEEDFKRGFKAWQLLTPEAVEQSVENIQRLINGEPLGGTEYRLKRLDGPEFPAIVFSRLIFEQGKPVGLRGAVVNITDRKRTEEVIRESEANFRRSMDDSPLGIRVVTADGETLYANRAILDMYGYASIEEFQGVPLKQRYTPESYAAYLARRAKRDRGERDQTEYTIDIVTQNGDIRNVRAFRKQIVWNGQPHDQIIYQDITRQIQAEEALRESVGNLRKALGGTIRAIASVVETKDPYTAGHQRRVADIARAIAQEMKLPRERIDGLRMAGIIHDIGKVSVPSEILSSPRKLSSLEFSLIKTHAQSGHDIVREIEFPWPIARIIIEHHERMDGSGYPNALTGDQILPESRILAVADVVEAMATHRPYRPSLGLEAALDEITQNRGRLYDPEVVDACLRLFREKDYTIRD